MLNQEPLPSYFAPDPSPPKYEHAIVNQIRGLRDDNVADDPTTSNDLQHGSAIPAPLWLPVYFAPNQSSFSFGRLHRHPSPSTASSSGPAWNSTEWEDRLRAFWNQQQNPLRVPPTALSSTQLDPQMPSEEQQSDVTPPHLSSSVEPRRP
ncbi:hypothetical protein DFQ28_002774 [Apophysomyces sp. BC1034]|nr:hypothetical protein DFQ30_003075 [Apophysomyces sp. BC1015]KAG0179536.1 hypothetical protein DFQ29_001948 [Apophysomyces sp. BC1021]KAG0189889.1 hypothetical protein DFQ28_002774 [Apophysomyces sp. BC1034]